MVHRVHEWICLCLLPLAHAAVMGGVVPVLTSRGRQSAEFTGLSKGKSGS